MPNLPPRLARPDALRWPLPSAAAPVAAGSRCSARVARAVAGCLASLRALRAARITGRAGFAAGGVAGKKAIDGRQ